MMKPQARLLPCGTRLHLRHGPIDLIIGADGDRENAFRAAKARFATVLDELVTELADLRRALTPQTPEPKLAIATRMDAAARPYAGTLFVTRMAAVAGSVADTILHSMTRNAVVSRAYVNNGGDIAIHLMPGQSFTTAMVAHDGTALGQIEIKDSDEIRGIATSGRHGRSHSFGIADSVTVLAKTAAAADVAATLIGNAVDLSDQTLITRRPACEIDEDSDLGTRLVVTGCGALPMSDTHAALASGHRIAHEFQKQNLILGAALFLNGVSTVTQTPQFFLSQRTPEYA